MIRRKILQCPLVLFCLSPLCEAQEQRKDTPAKHGFAEIAVIALGPKPTRKFEKAEHGAAAVMLLAQPGETPPTQLFFRNGHSEGKDASWTSLNIPFNNPTNLRQTPSDRELRFYRKLSGENHFEPYVTLPPVPAMMRKIFLLMPSKYDFTPWKTSPKIKVITLDSPDLTGKRLILANFSSHAVQHSFQGEVESVSPEKIITYQPKEMGKPCRLAARYGKEQKILYNTAVRFTQEGHTQLFVLYDTNLATNAGREVSVFRMTIPAREEIETTPE